LTLGFGIDSSGIDHAIKSTDKLIQGVNQQEYDKWTATVESTAKQICNDTKSDIELNAQGKKLSWWYKDTKSKDCLIRAIEMHLNSMPLFLQGIFKKFAEDLRAGRFNQ